MKNGKHIDPDGITRYFKDDQLHRDGDKPAIIWADGTVFYCKNDQQHRDGDLPAVIWANGRASYYKDGLLHREGDRPAMTYANGTVYYYKHGKQLTKEENDVHPETIEWKLQRAINEACA